MDLSVPLHPPARRVYPTGKLSFVSHGTVAGIYLRPEKTSRHQFLSVYLGPRPARLLGAELNQHLSYLHRRYGERNVDWYVEESFGLDIKGSVAWCNVDLTDQICA